jgi:hypothetical protein
LVGRHRIWPYQFQYELLIGDHSIAYWRPRELRGRQ